ncbi:hypothetical protein BJF83_24795 [Nocardiopsis sp. CNR-923]|nr:hypothetical protein BJF83_24795 [Nocardiopsis sp. CNR-923]
MASVANVANTVMSAPPSAALAPITATHRGSGIVPGLAQTTPRAWRDAAFSDAPFRGDLAERAPGVDFGDWIAGVGVGVGQSGGQVLVGQAVDLSGPFEDGQLVRTCGGWLR